jgi:hypothetical protein
MDSFRGAAGWGVILGAIGVGAAAGAMLAAAIRAQRPLRPAIAASTFYSLPLLALALALPLPLVAGSAALAGASGGFFGASWFTIFQRNVPREAISRISAWDWEASLAGLPLGMLLAPQLARLVGTRFALAAAAVSTVAVTVLVCLRPSLSFPTASPTDPVRSDSEVAFASTRPG